MIDIYEFKINFLDEYGMRIDSEKYVVQFERSDDPEWDRFDAEE